MSRGAVSTVTLVRLRTSTGTRIVSFNVSNRGALAYRNDVTGVDRYSSTIVSTGVWHELLLRVLVNGATSRVDVWYDGANVTALTRGESLGTTPLGRLQLGNDTPGRVYDVAFDALAVD